MPKKKAASSSSRKRGGAKGRAAPPAGPQQEAEFLTEDDAAAVWLLLLGTLWSDADLRACAGRLLRVSRSMQGLVHAGAAGRLALADRPWCIGEAASAACGWLAQHAVLLQELALDHKALDERGEEMSAAGLRAAAGAPSMAGGRVTRSRAASAITTAEACAAAALQRRSAGEQQQQQQQQQQPAVAGLPLCRARVSGSFGGTLLRSLASCCPQLTRLELLTRGNSAGCLARPPAAAALSAMTALRELHVKPEGCSGPSRDVTAMLPDLQALAQLTRLEVADGLGTTAGAAALPASLQHLALAGMVHGANLRRLSALQHLVCRTLAEAVELPQSLQQLTAQQLFSVDAIAPLLQLRSLAITDCRDEMAEVARELQRVTQLTSIEVRARGLEDGGDDDDLAFLLAALPSLPVTALALDYASECRHAHVVADVSDLQQLTRLSGHLTALEIGGVHVEGSAGELAAQVALLSRLRRLALIDMSLEPQPEWSADVEPLVAAVTGMGGLTELTVVGRLCAAMNGTQIHQLKARLGAGRCELDPYYADSDTEGPYSSSGLFDGGWDDGSDDGWGWDLGFGAGWGADAGFSDTESE